MPPLKDIISPTGVTIRLLNQLASENATVASEPEYLAQLEMVRQLAEKSAASRRAFLFAPDFGETE